MDAITLEVAAVELHCQRRMKDLGSNHEVFIGRQVEIEIRGLRTQGQTIEET